MNGSSASLQVSVPTSKSISNRLLMLKYLHFPDLSIKNLSRAEDTRLLAQLLEQVAQADPERVCQLNVRNCGTAYRFLLPYLAMRAGKWQLVGDARMKERPVLPLVSLLQQWGARMFTPEQLADMDPFETIPVLPPGAVPLLYIQGSRLHPQNQQVDLSRSSQFLSALMMVAPLFEHPVTFYYSSEIHSFSYVRMTASLMRSLSLRVDLLEDRVVVRPRETTVSPPPVRVAADWSSAAFWWAWVALQPAPYQLYVKHVHMDATQADSMMVSLLAPWGVCSSFDQGGVWITKSASLSLPACLQLNVSDCPDLVPLLVVLCSLLQLPALLDGAGHLSYKESDRIQALQTNLSPWTTVRKNGDRLCVTPMGRPHPPFRFCLYGDHRIAIALALFRSFWPETRLSPRQVVRKSYPRFWEMLDQTGKKK